MKHVMGERTIIATERAPLITMAGVIDQVGRDPDDLGYSLFYYIQQMAGLARELQSNAASRMPFLRPPPPPPIKLLAVDGVMPSKSAIATDSYTLREPVWVVSGATRRRRRSGCAIGCLVATGRRPLRKVGTFRSSVVRPGDSHISCST